MGTVPPPPTRYKKVNGRWIIDIERSMQELQEWRAGRERFYAIAFVAIWFGFVILLICVGMVAFRRISGQP